MILLADGRPIADAPAAEVLSGGWHFATETARVLGGAGRALTPEQGARRSLRGRDDRRRSRRELGDRVASCCSRSRWRLGFAWYERSQPGSRMLALVATLAGARGDRADRVRAVAERQADDRHRADRRLRARRGARLRRRRGRRAGLEPRLRAGPVDAVADGRLGALRAARRGARPAQRAPTRARAARARLRRRGPDVRRDHGPLGLGHRTRAAHARPVPRDRPATSLPFNIAHAAGNVVFCLAFGPVLVRALMRYRSRLEVRWRDLPAPAARRGAAAGRVGVAALRRRRAARAAPPSDPAARASATAASRAAAYLARAQQPNGAWGASPRRRTTYAQTTWSVIGLAAAGRDPGRVRARRRSGVDVLWSGARLAAARPPTSSARSSRSPPRADRAPRTRRRPRRAPARRARTATAAFDRLVNLTAFGVLALRAAGRRRRRSRRPARRGGARAAQQNARRRLQLRGPRRSSGIDDTAGALQALAVVRGAGARVGAARRGVPRAAARTPTAASAPAAGSARTPSRRRSPSRACSPPAASPTASAAAARARRSPTCARSRPPTAACATAARARRRRSGSPPRRSPRWRGARCRCAAPPHAGPPRDRDRPHLHAAADPII